MLPQLPQLDDVRAHRFARFTMTDVAPIAADADGAVTHLEGLAVPWDTPTTRFGVPVAFLSLIHI